MATGPSARTAGCSIAATSRIRCDGSTRRRTRTAAAYAGGGGSGGAATSAQRPVQISAPRRRGSGGAQTRARGDRSGGPKSSVSPSLHYFIALSHLRISTDTLAAYHVPSQAWPEVGPAGRERLVCPPAHCSDIWHLSRLGFLGRSCRTPS